MRETEMRILEAGMMPSSWLMMPLDVLPHETCSAEPSGGPPGC